MKNNYLIAFIFLFVSANMSAQQVWDNFQDIRKVDYGFINGTLIPYFGNPDQSGVNDSRVVAQYSRNSVETFDVLIIEAPMADLTDYVSGTKQISMDVWSPAAGTVIQITLENSTLSEPANYPTGRHSVYLDTTTVAGAWETLTFTFFEQPDAMVANDNVDNLVLLFNPNSNTGDTYYFDNVNGPELVSDPCDGVTPDPMILNDFECNQNVNYIFSSSGVNFKRIPNPDMTGNPSSHVATYTRNAGEQNDVLIGLFDGNLMLESNSTLSIDVWDPAPPSNITFSLQTVTNDVIISVDKVTSAASTWETITFDVSSVFASDAIGQFVILFDPETFTSGQYFFDNFQFGEPVSTNDISPLSNLKVYPNPALNNATISYELNAPSEVVIDIIDAQGRVLNTIANKAGTGAQSTVIPTENLANGLYFYTLTVDGKQTQGRLIVSH